MVIITYLQFIEPAVNFNCRKNLDAAGNSLTSHSSARFNDWTDAFYVERNEMTSLSGCMKASCVFLPCLWNRFRTVVLS